MKLHGPIPPALPEPFHKRPDPDGIVPGSATLKLVDAQVGALLAETPSYGDLTQDERSAVHDRMVHIASYAAELVRDDWYHSEILGQRPLIKEKMEMIPSNTDEPDRRGLEKTNRRHSTAQSTPARIQSKTALARAQSGDGFVPSSANQVARVTRETLRAIAFPTFVADLIRGSFQAIVDSTIQQMEAFGELLSNVSKSVDEFMADNITDNQARDWLAARYPGLMRVNTGGETPRLNPIDTDADTPMPDFRAELNIPDSIDSLDESVLEETLVPAARRRLAQSRLQVLSTMVMMGLQRIVVKHGRIRATMAFHIDASDRMHREEATDFDFSTQLSGSASFLTFSASMTTSITYVRSTRMTSDTELNVAADLTGEVDITFESDYMPLNRFASAAQIEQIRANTPVPENNAPTTAAIGTPAVAAAG